MPTKATTLFHLCLALPVLLLLGFGPGVPSLADPSPADQVKEPIDKALAHPYMARGFQGVHVVSMDTGKVIYDHYGDHLLTPASCMKIIVTSAALDLLGPDYKMTTSLYAAAAPEDGVLNGDLILVGSGDSVLKIEDLKQMVDKLKLMGVTKIKGNIVGDETYFEGTSIGIGCDPDDEAYSYATPVSALSLNKNYIDTFIRPGAKVGDPAVVEIRPATSYFTIKNECVTGPAKSASTADTTRLRAENVVLATGSIPVDSKPTDPIEQLSMEKPALFTVTILKELLEKNGIKVKGNAVLGMKPAQAVLIASHDSPPLSEIVNILNKPSDNFMAESLLKTLGKELKGKGTFDAGIEVEKDWLRKIGADMGAIRIADASGLSRRNSISAQNLTTVLTQMYRTRNYGILSNSFPIAGVDSHLKDRMLNTPAVNNVKAKTGYVSLVCSLSGYVTTLAGENLAVSIVQNNHTCSLDEANVIQDIIFVALSKITTRTDAAASPAAK